MLCRRFREYSPIKVWKIQIPGRPNQGMPKNRGLATNPNTSGSSRAGRTPFVPRFALNFTVNTNSGLHFQRDKVQQKLYMINTHPARKALFH
jgi:hypothetical protein